jgi:hypothetical protein
MIKVIWDNGTPNCLPAWARDELVRYRLQNSDLKVRNAELMRDLMNARGASPEETFAAMMKEGGWRR